MKDKFWNFVADHIEEITYTVAFVGVLGLMYISYKLGTYDC